MQFYAVIIISHLVELAGYLTVVFDGPENKPTLYDPDHVDWTRSKVIMAERIHIVVLDIMTWCSLV
jgi:hypothetical protein